MILITEYHQYKEDGSTIVSITDKSIPDQLFQIWDDSKEA